MRTYTIVKNKTRTGDKKVTGTFEELCKHFGKPVKGNIAGLLNRIKAEYADREATIYDRTTFTLITHTAAETKAMAKEKVARTKNLFDAIDSAFREPEKPFCCYCGGC